MGDQFAHGFLHHAVGVQRRLEEIHVEGHAERGQVAVLLVAQPGHGEVADRVEVVRVAVAGNRAALDLDRSEEHTSELQSLMRISYAVFCLKKKTTTNHNKDRYQLKNKQQTYSILHHN